MFVPDIIQMEDGSIYIGVRNYMEYSIDEWVEYKNITIDLHKVGDTSLLVGVQIKNDGEIKYDEINFTKTMCILDSMICCIKFNIEHSNGDWVSNIEVSPNIEVYLDSMQRILGLIVKRNIKSEEMEID
jgi:hypothetical protein